jgi:hypothetical protein
MDAQSRAAPGGIPSAWARRRHLTACAPMCTLLRMTATRLRTTAHELGTGERLLALVGADGRPVVTSVDLLPAP